MDAPAPDVEADRRASIAFHHMTPPLFEGNIHHYALLEWMHSVEIVFATCHTPPHLRVLLASERLRGNALVWWLRLGVDGQDIDWPEFCARLRAEYQPPPPPPAAIPMPPTDPIIWEDWRRRCSQSMIDIWDTYPGESIDHYIIRFRRTLLPVFPPETTLTELCDVLWMGLTDDVKILVNYPLEYPTLGDFINELRRAAAERDDIAAAGDDADDDMGDDDDDEDDEEEDDDDEADDDDDDGGDDDDLPQYHPEPVDVIDIDDDEDDDDVPQYHPEPVDPIDEVEEENGEDAPQHDPEPPEPIYADDDEDDFDMEDEDPEEIPWGTDVSEIDSD